MSSNRRSLRPGHTPTFGIQKALFNMEGYTAPHSWGHLGGLYNLLE